MAFHIHLNADLATGEGKTPIGLTYHHSLIGHASERYADFRRLLEMLSPSSSAFYLLGKSQNEIQAPWRSESTYLQFAGSDIWAEAVWR